MMTITLTIDTIYSPDDGGCYAEIYDDLGREVHCTRVVDFRLHAKRLATEWIEKQKDKPAFRYGKEI